MQVRLFPTRTLPSDLRPQGPPGFRNPASTNPRSQDEKESALWGRWRIKKFRWNSETAKFANLD